MGPEERIELNPADAKELGVSEGDFIKVSSRRGKLIARASVTERVAPNNIFGTFHFWEASVNELTNAAALDPICGIPEYKGSAARVEKSSSAEAKAWQTWIAGEYRVEVERDTNAVLAGRI
jgi:formate dehydrogenase major subunit